MLTCCAGIQCVLQLRCVSVVGRFAATKVFLQAHCILPYQGLVGLAQLNFDARLLVIEAFDFIFHLSVCKNGFLGIPILYPFSGVNCSMLVRLHVSLLCFTTAIFDFLCQYPRFLSSGCPSLSPCGRQIIRRLLHFMTLRHNRFRFFSIFTISILKLLRFRCS